jgi:hypothetical protein
MDAGSTPGRVRIGRTKTKTKTKIKIKIKIKIRRKLGPSPLRCR